MNVRKVRRKCGMRGCKCTDSYALSLTSEMGNSIIVCKSCLEKAHDAIENYKEDTTSVKKVSREAPPLFFNAKAMGKKSERIPEAEPVVNDDKDATEEEKPDLSKYEGPLAWVCPHCGKEFATEKGLNTHMRTCKEKE